MIKALVQRAPVVWLLIVSILVFGSAAYMTLPREAAPDIKIPVVMITTAYIGVSPADIESIITIPMENELAGVKDIKKMSSTSAEGASIISLEFEPEVVIEDALQRVRDRVNRVKPRLPEDAEEPAVREISFSDFPILIINIAGKADPEELKSLAEEVEDEVRRIPGVLDTTISGGLERQIRVQIDPRRLSRMGFSLDDVINAIGSENVNIPGGEINSGDSTFLLRVPGEFQTAEQIGAVAVKRQGDSPVFIRDLGQVIDGYADVSSYARMDGNASVSLAVTKRAGAGIIEINDEVKRIVAEHARTWPEGVTYRALADQSKRIKDMVADLENNIISALILVVGVLLFFMGARNSLFVALSIPLSMLMSFALLQMLGLTLNMIVLFSLILALGMLVDNAIVIVENIYRHAEEGADLFTASVEGTREVAIAVAASTATTVAAFAPLVFWTGIMGQFMGYLPKTVIIVLTCSLVVAVGILPVITRRFMRVKKGPSSDITQSRSIFVRAYRATLELSIRFRYLSAAAGFASLFGTFVIYGFFNHGTEFFPATQPNRATISLRAPDGTSLEETDRVVRRVESVLQQTENVDVYVAETGMAGGGSPIAGAQAQANQARITVDFLPDRNNALPGEKVRVESTFETIDRLRESVAEIPGVSITVDPERMGPPVGKPIAVEVSGKNFQEVGELAARVRREISAVPGVTDLSDDYRVGRPELRLRVDRGAAKRVGASTMAVANAVRTAVAGSKASTLRDGTDEYDIMVELEPRWRHNLQDVLSLQIPGREDKSPDTFQVPLSTVASFEMRGGSGSIRHIDQDLVVTIGGDVSEGMNENAVRESVVKRIEELRTDGTVPAGFDLRLGGANDEQRNAQEFLGRAFAIAIALIAIVLVAQFNNIRLPAIILMTVVLSLIGVLWGLLLTGTSFGVIMTGLGVISLAGVVVNNAIVLLDYVEQLRARGLGVHDALIRAGLTRLRPVMLTAITTVLGLVPMAVGWSYDFRNMKPIIGSSSAQFWSPMAIAVIFGLGFATILTLVMVPTFYSIFDDFDRLMARIFKRQAAVVSEEADQPGEGLVAPAKIVLGMLLLGGLAAPAQARPLSLEEATSAAQDRSIDLQLLHEQTVQTRAGKGQVWALISPRVTAQGSYTINQYETVLDFNLADMLPEEYQALFADVESDPIVVQKKSYWAANATITQPLFNAEAFPMLKSLDKSIAASEKDEERGQDQVRAGVARAFYNLALSQELARLSSQNKESAEQHLELARRQVEAGTQPQRAMLQARLAVAQADRIANNAKTTLAQARESFWRLTGIEGDVEPVLPPPVEVPADHAAAWQAALGHRPDLAAAEFRSDFARLQHQGRNLEWLPTLNGRFTWSWSENSGFSPSNDSWLIVLSADWTLWDGGLRLAQSRTAASQHRAADLAVERATQQIHEEVRSAWERYQQAESSLAHSDEEIALAEENLRLAEAALKAGSATWLEVEDARIGLLQAKVNAMTERGNRDLAAMDLRLAVGE